MPEPLSPTEIRRASVLIVDDEDQQCRLLSFLLRRDFDVSTAVNGDRALDLARKQNFDVAVVDYRMPGMTGIEVLRDLKQIQPTCVRMLMTAHALPSILEEGTSVAGIYRFLSKPVDAEMLRIDLQRALEHQRDAGRGEKAPDSPRVGDLAQCLVREISGALDDLHRAERASLGASPSKKDGDNPLGAAVTALSVVRDALRMIPVRAAVSSPQSIAEAAKGAVRTWEERRARASDPVLTIQIESELPPLPFPSGALEGVLFSLARSVGGRNGKSASVVLRARKIDAQYVAVEIWREGERPPAARAPASRAAPHAFDAELPLDLNVARWIIEASGGRVTRSVMSSQTQVTAVFLSRP